MHLTTVNQEKCIKCGFCVNECPEQLFKLGENGPEEVYPQSCIACKEALDNRRTPLANQISSKNFPILSPEEAEQFLRSRRSIRSYKKTSAPRETLTKLVNIAHYAPTGHNLQGISYIVIDDRNILDQAVEAVISEFENDKQSSQSREHFIKPYRMKGIDTILRGAPNLVLAIADADFSRGRENAIFSLAYLELYAPTLGLGSCWAGLLERVALKDHSPMLSLFHIPEGKKITGAVMVGYPKYSYPRLVERNPLEVTFL